MAYINENVERLHSEKLQIQAEIQRLGENRYSANEKIICDFDRFDELPFERKRELANAVIKKSMQQVIKLTSFGTYNR